MGKITDEEKMNLVKEAVQDLKDGKLGHYSFAIVVASVIDPQAVTREDLEWAEKRLEQIRAAQTEGGIR